MTDEGSVSSLSDAQPDTRRFGESLRAGFGPQSAAGVAALLAISVGAISAICQRWTPVSDMALIELHVRDVPSHLPLLGAYSRFGWSHPGPAQYLLLALPYRLLGAASWSIPTATVLMNLLAVCAAWRIARSMNRLAGALLLLSAMTLVAGGEPSVLRNWWNPYVGAILMLTLVVAAWAAAERRAWPTFAVLPIATLLVQSHVGYAAVALPVAFAGFVLMACRRGGNEDEHPIPWRHLIGGAALAAVMWLPPLIEQFAGNHADGSHGNLVALMRSGTGSGQRAGLGMALRLLSENLGLPPTWAGREAPQFLGTLTPHWTVPVLVVLPIFAVILAWRRRSYLQLRAMTVAGAGLLGAVAGVASIHGSVYPYLLPWLSPVVVALIGISCWTLVSLPQERMQVLAIRVSSALVVVLACVVVAQQIPPAEFDAGTADAARRLSSALISDAHGQPVYIDAAPDFSSAATYGGVVLAAERSGLDIRVPEVGLARFGAHRVGSTGGRVEYFIAQPDNVADLVADGWQVVASHDPFSAEEHATLSRLRSELDRLGDSDANVDSDTARGRIVQRILKIEDTRITAVLLSR